MSLRTPEEISPSPTNGAGPVREHRSNGARTNGDRREGNRSADPPAYRPDDPPTKWDEEREATGLDPFEAERQARAGAGRRFITY